AARGAFHRVVAGRVEVGGIGGSLLTGVVLNDVVIYDPDSTLVARLPHAEVDYNPLDFVAGRIVLSGVTLDHPYINLVQHKNGRLNLEELLRLGGPPSGRPATLVVLRNLRIEDGTVVVRLQDRPSPDDTLHEIENAGADGRRRFRRFVHLTARGAVLHGDVDIRSHGGRLLEVHIDPLDLAYRGGRLTGKLTAVSAADSGLVAVRQTDVQATDLDLGLAHAFLDSLPFYGRLTGHTRADGGFGRLALEVDWLFRDSLVAGWRATRVRGRGDVDLLSGGLSFRGFGVEAATVDLRTVRRLAPAVTLHGVLDAAGT